MCKVANFGRFGFPIGHSTPFCPFQNTKPWSDYGDPIWRFKLHFENLTNHEENCHCQNWWKNDWKIVEDFSFTCLQITKPWSNHGDPIWRFKSYFWNCWYVLQNLLLNSALVTVKCRVTFPTVVCLCSVQPKNVNTRNFQPNISVCVGVECCKIECQKCDALLSLTVDKWVCVCKSYNKIS